MGWDGNELSGWIVIDGAPAKVSADRDTIHADAPDFNDALTWEIKRHQWRTLAENSMTRSL
jgi:hypothetical protein